MRPDRHQSHRSQAAAGQHENLSMPRPDGAKRFVSRVACEHDRRMGAEQLDLFTSGPIAEAIPVRAEVPAAETLSDEAAALLAEGSPLPR
jgi:hypothetical protein